MFSLLYYDLKEKGKDDNVKVHNVTDFKTRILRVHPHTSYRIFENAQPYAFKKVHHHRRMALIFF